MTEQSVPNVPVIPFGGLVKIEKDGWEGVPDSPSPFYIGARDGLYLHRRMVIGRGVVRVDSWPTFFPAFGNAIGRFNFEADPIPAQMMGQIVNFFERTYDRQHTEAAVLLLMHTETKQWRVFVPTQLVSHGGVNYVFDPAHIPTGWVVAGSIHSHCDFGAGHSSTDTTDADGSDGLHCTIGMIKRDIPMIVAMVSMNKKLMHYAPDQFPFLFDFSEAKQHKAPDWWDRYVENTVDKVKPVGFDLYAKFDRPTVVKSETKITQVSSNQNVSQHVANRSWTGYNADDWVYNDKLKRMVHKSWTIGEDGTIYYDPRQSQGPANHSGQLRVVELNGEKDPFSGLTVEQIKARGYTWDTDLKTWRWTGGGGAHGGGSQILRESEDFNSRIGRVYPNPRWGSEDELIRETKDIREQEDPFWEDNLNKDLVDLMFDSELITDDDIDTATRSPLIASDPDFWTEVFMKKAIRAVHVLREMGVNVKLQFRAVPPSDMEVEEALLPEGKPVQEQLLLPAKTGETTQQPEVH